ncbi:pyrroline-5-carboxylate reductase [Bacillus aquiflavi]|uniref:Pyrroline-5-carboxylate reductase n=2 Tax=Bacillus aquiflavi TaxID=2672567 RepID=A0A6B3W011_9BACI|nr:pyrroline-5-carboxylate reductase [Bacillus aquiflavi]MBA4538203.1 pyrroline-5-carboxylate reductase [Bacillus aquiflavi]NEY82522.1 pyrroline-5-carboxylate reductase [Bacillus aquiflavi]UAC47164.1 pyrroline-5-carboxylate reductase [Bacillus aquiflavi]
MKKLAMIGAGSIAEALIAGLVENQLLPGGNIYVTNRHDKNRLEQLYNQYGVTTTYNLTELFSNADVVILAMKPKDAATALQNIKEHLTKDILIVSVLAGVSIKSIETLAGKRHSIIRAMPNTSAAIGKSATALAANDKVSEIQKNEIKKIFETVGLATFVEEYQLDAVTGLSGSGPAYIYYLVEAMEKSAMEIGLEQKTAKELIIQTLLGAAEMLTKSPKPPQQLRREVTSPGGTTEAGIRILDAHGVQRAVISCIKEATAQSKRLGSMLSTEINKSKQLS